ncbi:oxidoreductase [Lithospermum erythrorhizon]|uniref:Oxidoreductase n=1 Tax=Lithospermum erythrorhizon TaxID=34254 RepID=A0AAV3QMR8_LITER
MKGISSILRRFGSRPYISSSSSTLMISTAAASYIIPEMPPTLFHNYAFAPTFTLNFHPNNNFINYRNFSSQSPSGPSNLVVIESEEQFNDSLRKACDEDFPAIFYFTAAWCGPCRLLSPIIGQLSEKYPHVTTFKVDIDKEGLAGPLGKLAITAVPTLHFFQKGKKASEVVGADVQRLKDTMEELYKL